MPPTRPSKRRRTSAARGPPPPAGQQPGELQAACAAEHAPGPVGGWPAPAADSAAAIRRLALSTFLQDRLAPADLTRGRLIDLIGVTGGFVDGGLEGRAIVQQRRVFGLPPAAQGRAINSLPPELRAAVEALLYAPGWAGPAWMETGDEAGGFRQLVHFPDFRIAVSRVDRIGLGRVMEDCRPPEGWRAARASELVGAGFTTKLSESWYRTKLPEASYYDSQAGWDGDVWAGVCRFTFVTADWETVEPSAGGAVFVSSCEGKPQLHAGGAANCPSPCSTGIPTSL